MWSLKAAAPAPLERPAPLGSRVQGRRNGAMGLLREPALKTMVMNLPWELSSLPFPLIRAP